MKTTFPIVDTDIHPMFNNQAVGRRLPEPYRTRYLMGNRAFSGSGYWNPNGVNRRDAVTEDGQQIATCPKLLAEHLLDAHGMIYGVLNPGASLGFCVSSELDYVTRCAIATNDTMIEDWLAVDERYLGSLTVASNDPQSSVAEIRRVGGHPQMVQVYMSSATQVPLGSRFYWPIYEAACEMNLPVAIHPGLEGSGISNPPSGAGTPGSYFEWHSIIGANFMGQVCSLIAEGVFQQFPKLKFLLIEGGVSWLVPLLWRMDKNWKALRQTVPYLDRPPSEVAFDHLRLSTQPIEEPARKEHLHQLLAMFPAEKMLMFSTDYPHWDGDTPDFTARYLPEHLRAPVMYQTACETFGLKLPETADV